LIGEIVDGARGVARGVEKIIVGTREAVGLVGTEVTGRNTFQAESSIVVVPIRARYKALVVVVEKRRETGSTCDG
jgi:hypothetical protein